jgi:predicted secreted Zn-dependent protease
MPLYDKTILLFLLLFLLPLTTFAKPELKTRNIYYTVSGNSAEDIWADIRKKSPVKHNGKLHVAYTKWNVNWQFWWLEKAELCEITRVKTIVDVAYTLPRLKQTAAMPDALSSRWQQYHAALLDHEQGHKELGMKAANEIENTISNMEPHTTCKQLEQAANEMGKEIINKYSKIEKDYDRSTNHGLNTGAVFP